MAARRSSEVAKTLKGQMESYFSLVDAVKGCNTFAGDFANAKYSAQVG